VVAILAVLGGCNWFRSPVEVSNAPGGANGLVVVLTGIEGASYFNQSIVEGLLAGGVDYQIERVDWTSHIPLAYVYNERAENRNRRKAKDLATRIARYQAQHIGKPVYLVGQSGGGAIAAWIAEELPAGYRVDGIVMLTAALSPEYVLSEALMNSRQGIVSFYSERDVVLLGAGTTMVGTMDGEHTSSAGRVGFHLPSPECRPFYRHLYQVPWSSEMEGGGNWGLHLTSGSARFVANYVAPLVRAKKWDDALVQDVASGRVARGLARR
jgi:pimeloyl-ACP methyl ester carboxylesterase